MEDKPLVLQENIRETQATLRQTLTYRGETGIRQKVLEWHEPD